MLRIHSLLAMAALAMVSACEKSTAKFHPGDKVVVKDDPRIKGIVEVRLSPLGRDQYYLRVAGKPRGGAGTWIETGRGDYFTGPGHPSDSVHLDGAYFEDQLELDHR